MSRVRGCISFELGDEAAARALAEALTVEARNPPDPDRGRASVEARGGLLLVCIEARDLAAARALLNAYLSLAATALDALAVSGGAPLGGKAPTGGRVQA